jgi:flagellar motor component MotA
MLGWEVFWLRRMYQALQNMPTTDQMSSMVKQLSEMVKSINEGKRVVEQTFTTISSLIPFSGMLGGLLGGSKPVEQEKKG